MSGDESGGSQRTVGRPHVPPGPLADLKALLYRAYLEAGTPRLDDIAAWVREDDELAGSPGRDTVARVIGDAGVPASQADVIAVATVLARAAHWDSADTSRRARDLWMAARMAVPAGVPLGAVTDPFVLEVHRPVEIDDAPAGLPVLPPYVSRPHDERLAQVVQAAAEEGHSRIAVLVGGSSTGKTRACWEALGLLKGQAGQWRLWHPIDPSPPGALLAGLAEVGPRTVVWLNEAQFYLDPPDAAGERVAAGLRELLRDPGRAPVLVLATLWPQFWEALATRPPSGPDPHAQARALLSGHGITVAAAFTPAEVGELARSGDVRLALAARLAQDGEVTQFLAAAPELLDRYSNAPPGAKAMITAAMDARRLGAGPGLTQAFLEAAAPGYLTGTEWDAVGDDWAEQALACAVLPCKGARGPLTRIRPRLAMRTSVPSGGGEATYRLTGYLDQHGRATRADQIPPAGLWAAAAAHAKPADQAVLGIAAHDRGLYRDAAQLHKNAAVAGIFRSAIYLARPPDCLSGDPAPFWWAATHASLSDPSAVARLLESLQEAGARDPAAALIARDPASSVSLSDPAGVATLLNSLQEAGAHEQATALIARDPASSVSLSDPAGVGNLVASLRRAGERRQAATLAARAAASEDFSDLARASDMVGTLRAAGEDRQAATLAARAAAHASLSDPAEVAGLLFDLRQAGARKQLAALIARDPGVHASLSELGGVALLLDRLKDEGADEQFTALAGRAAVQADLSDPYGVAMLLGTLRAAGTHEQATVLIARDPASSVSLSNLNDVARLLGVLREAGADEQFTALAGRAAVQADLSDPYGVAMLLGTLRAAGARSQATALIARDPASSVTISNLGGVAKLLRILRGSGHEQMTALIASRLARLSNPYAVAILLYSFLPAGAQERSAAADITRETGADEQFAALADRAAAYASLRDPLHVGMLLDGMRETGAARQVAVLLARDPAARADFSRYGVMSLLASLRNAGAQEQAAVLVSRLPATGWFERFLKEEGRQDRLRFGQEADGSPALPWGWEDLE